MVDVKIPPENNIQVKNMLEHDVINKIFTLRSCGWGFKLIAKELGISKRTVKKYIRRGQLQVTQRRSTKQLADLGDWLEENYVKHGGNADVLRQLLMVEHDRHVSLRTVERAVQHLRQEELVKAKATIRFETRPGKQLQIDFGSLQIMIGGIKMRIYLFVATLGYSRRMFIQAFLHERQTAWFRGLEGAFLHFNGVPQQVLLDNAKPLVTAHNIVDKEVIFNERLKAFARYWGFTPVACSPYRARTKGKDERMVSYVKRNAIAGRSFVSLYELSSHLERWNAQIADLRIHDTVQERPIERFQRDEANTLQILPNHPSFMQLREFSRRVHTDSCIEFETNWYSVPSEYVDKLVTIQVFEKDLKVMHNGEVIAHHNLSEGRRQRNVVFDHLKGIVGAKTVYLSKERVSFELLRPLDEYEKVAGGGW